MKSLFYLAFVATLAPFAASATSLSNGFLLDLVRNDKSYLKEVHEAELHGATFGCSKVFEVLESKNYSTSNSGPSTYTMVLLKCSYNPQDGLGSIRRIGVATISDGQVLSFVNAWVNQAD